MNLPVVVEELHIHMDAHLAAKSEYHALGTTDRVYGSVFVPVIGDGVRPVTRIKVCRSTPHGSKAVNFANWRFGEKRSWFVYLSAVIGRAL